MDRRQQNLVTSNASRSEDHGASTWSDVLSRQDLHNFVLQPPRRGQALQTLDNIALSEKAVVASPSQCSTACDGTRQQLGSLPPVPTSPLALKAQRVNKQRQAKQEMDTSSPCLPALDAATGESDGHNKGSRARASAAKHAASTSSRGQRRSRSRSRSRSNSRRSDGLSAKDFSHVQSAFLSRPLSPSDIPASKYAGARRLPLKLPSPQLALISDPYQDLPAHLRRHGLFADAENLKGAEGITADFMLHAWMTTIARDGPAGLLNATSIFMDRHGDCINQQLSDAQSKSLPIPLCFDIPAAELAQAESQAPGVVPTHILAVHSRDPQERGFLIPCHGLLYALQCVSLPSLASRRAQESEGRANLDGAEAARGMPVISVTVPRPSEFAVTHRFMYLRSASTFTTDLLPMKHILEYAADQRRRTAEHDAMMMPPPMHASLAASSFRSTASLSDAAATFAGAPALSPSEFSAMYGSDLPPSATPSSAAAETTSSSSIATPTFTNAPPQPAPRPATMASCTVEALAQLPVPELLSYAYRIHATWANGVAIGVLSNEYWSTLDRVWSLIMAALGMKKRLLIDAERSGMKLDLSQGPNSSETVALSSDNFAAFASSTMRRS